MHFNKDIRKKSGMINPGYKYLRLHYVPSLNVLPAYIAASVADFENWNWIICQGNMLSLLKIIVINTFWNLSLEINLHVIEQVKSTFNHVRYLRNLGIISRLIVTFGRNAANPVIAPLSIILDTVRHNQTGFENIFLSIGQMSLKTIWLSSFDDVVVSFESFCEAAPVSL